MGDNYLDNYKDAYVPGSAYSLDNKLILTWYPDRILLHAHGDSLLELGLGHGYTARIFSSRFSKYRVIEGSREVIDHFMRMNPAANFQIANGYFEDFTTEDRFDIIVMGFVLEHVESPESILRQYKRFLNKGGSIFIAVPNAEALNKRFGLEAGLIDDLFKLSGSDLDQGHRRLFSVESLKELVIREGFEIACIEGLFLKPITTQQIQELNLSEAILRSMMVVGVGYPELCVGMLMKITVPDSGD